MSVTTIGPNAFMDCIKLATITLPESVKKINDYAFYDCINLKSICIENQRFYDLGNKVFAESHELEDFYCYSEWYLIVLGHLKAMGGYLMIHILNTQHYIYLLMLLIHTKMQHLGINSNQ